MLPLTSLHDHSPVKPVPSIETNKTIEELDSYIDNIEGHNNDTVADLSTKIKECVADKSYPFTVRR